MSNSIRFMILCLIVTMSCDQSVSYEEASLENRDRFEDSRELEDANFLVTIRSRSMLAIKVLRLAADSGYSSVVVNFAKTALPEHKKLDEDIIALSREKKVSLPDELSPEDQILLSQLTSSSREGFDNTFSRIVTRVNEDYNTLFTTKATQASDADIRAFAARKLDLLRAHSQQLSTMRSQLMNTIKTP